MVTELLVYFSLLSLGVTILVVLVPGAVRARLWWGLPLGALAAAAAAYGLYKLTADLAAAELLTAWAVLFALVARVFLERWSYLASLLLTGIVFAGVGYLIYSVLAARTDPLGPVVWAGTIALLLLELVAFGLSLSYAYEVLDVLSRRAGPQHYFDSTHLPLVAIQVPSYNEPVDVVARTLESLARLDYPNLLVQVVDNNTRDQLAWRPLEALCRTFGPRFQFIHLEPWPGYKAGALNEATRRLPPEVEVIGIVDADYVVAPSWLRDTVGYFADPAIGFVQTPQHYRDWEDDRYLRGLFYSYRYFFDVTMPARANRNAIIFAGTMGLIRRSALDQVGGWSTATVTEDAEASLRMLGAGWRGVYVPWAYGEGLMPLTFDGLKKQRFRWALGGIQILRMHWREMLPFWPGQRFRLTVAQRIHYLLGSVQWFGDLLTAAFTLLLLITAAVTVVHHRLPVREIVGPLALVPLLFLVTGVGRALWAIRATSHCSLGDAWRCLRCWFALSWVVALACLRGLARREAAFLRTPKRKEGQSIWQAIRASRTESVLAMLAAAAAVAIVVRAPSTGTVVLAILLLWLALLYASAPWASFAAEGIRLTPLRRAYRQSPQSTGDWTETRRGVPVAAVAFPAGIAIGAALIAAFLILSPQAPSQTPPPADLPRIGQVPEQTPTPRPTPTPTPTPTATPTPRPTPTPTPTATPRAAPTATPRPSP